MHQAAMLRCIFVFTAYSSLQWGSHAARTGLDALLFITKKSTLYQEVNSSPRGQLITKRSKPQSQAMG